MSESTVVSTIIDDRDPTILYLPDASDWTVHTQVGAQYQLHGDSDTFSDRQGASIQFTFFGDAIEYWGNQGPAHGPCMVNLDGADQQTINSNAVKDNVPISLFKKEGLQKELHTIKITVVNASPPNVCELDRFIISNTTSVDGKRPTTTITSTSTRSFTSGTAIVASPDNKPGSSDPPWAIIGGAIGGGVLLILILLGLWCCLKSNKKKKRARNVHNPRNVHNTRNVPNSRNARGTHARTRSSIHSHRDEKPAIPPPTLANNVEKAGFIYGDGVPPTMHAQGPPQGPPQGYPPPLSPPLSPHQQHQQLFNQFGQPVAAQPTHPMNSGLSVHSTGRGSSPSHSRGPSRTSTSTYVPGHVRPFSQASSGLDYYQPHQQPLQHPQEYAPHHPPQEYPQHHPQEYPQHHPQEYPQHHPQEYPQHHPQEYPQHHPQEYPQHHPQEYSQHHPPQHYPQHQPEQYPEQYPQQPSQQYPQYNHSPQPAVLPVWASGETIAGTGFTPVVAGGTPAPVQRTATLPTPAPGVTDSSPGLTHEKAVYSRSPQPESTPGAGGSGTPGDDLMGEGSGSRAAPEAPPPAYNAYNP